MPLPLRIALPTFLLLLFHGPASAQTATNIGIGVQPQAKLPTTEAKVLWRYSAEKIERRDGSSYQLGLSDVAAFGDTVYFGDDRGRLYALRSSDGVMFWKHSQGNRIAQRPALNDKQLFFASSGGVGALDRKTGRLLWKYTLDLGASESTPYPWGAKVFTAGYDGQAYALNAANGKLLWRQDIVEDAPADPPGVSGERARFQDKPARPRRSISDGKTVYLSVFDQCRLIAMDAATGKKKWSFQTKGWVYGQPAISGGVVAVGSQDKHMYCLNKDSGKMIWKFPTRSRIETGAVIHDGSVYFVSCDGALYRVGLMSGKEIWKFRTTPADMRRTAIYSVPLITTDTAYFAAGEGLVYAVELATGKLRWKLRPSEDSELYTTPATDGRRLFVVSRPRNRGKGESAVWAIGAAP